MNLSTGAAIGARYSTAIIKCPTGVYTVRGSVPTQMVREDGRTKIFQTEQEAVDALLEIGLTHFQKADCSWYDA